MRTLSVYLVAIVTLLTQAVAFAVPANASTPSSSTTVSTSATQITPAQFIEMAAALRASDTPRTSKMDQGIEFLTFNLEDTVFLQLPYLDGEPYTPPTPRVGFGAVCWSAYVELNSAEQAALAVGTAGTIFGALTKNAATAGLAATIIGVATANGICSGGRTLRIYFPSFLMTECR